MKIIKLLIVDLLLFIFVFSAEAQIVVTSTTASSYGPPTVTTNSPSSITENTVVLGGTITNNGGQPITEKGICWSDSKDGNEQKLIIKDDLESDSFESKFQGFIANTSYYVRAYATNAAGTSYGKQLEFKTKKGIVRSIREKGLVIRPEIGVGFQTDSHIAINLLCNVLYQINPYLSLGGGTGLNYNNFERNLGHHFFSIPIYANIRGYLCNKKLSPYYDIKLGYNCNTTNETYLRTSEKLTNLNLGGFYADFGLGAQYKNYDFGIELILYPVNYDRYFNTSTSWEIPYNWEYRDSEKEFDMFSVCFKFGYNFQIKKKK